ncbi:MAG: HRDC domain-containing protein, partial [Xanthomonadales bacterium]|nr:HRDC domain-containing protein [Xanthomonadales bacterium]
GQRFGVGHLVKVLLGLDDERVRKLGHDRVSTFGIGSELDDSQWRGVFRQLVAGGWLAADTDGYNTLHLTQTSAAVLKGEVALQLRRQADRSERRESRRSTKGERVRKSLDIAPHEEPLWNALRDTRARLAKEQGVPAYVIFHDATLLEMLRERPADLAAFASISGVGEQKLARYAEAFITVLADAVH